MQANAKFISRIISKTVDSLSSFPSNNRDVFRYPYQTVQERIRFTVVTAAQQIAARFGFVRYTDWQRQSLQSAIEQLEPYLPALEEVYSLLADEESKARLIELAVFRVGGAGRCKLSRNDTAYWEAVKSVTECVTSANVMPCHSVNGWMHDFDLRKLGFDIRLRANNLCVLNTFALQQYRYSSASATVEVNQGDVVLDGGGCWGDSALYFASRSGHHGRVHVFEFTPENIAVLNQNISNNPALAPSITLHQQAIWDRSGETLNFLSNGPSTVVGDTKAKESTSTIAISDFCKSMEKVDFIKLDIEGAEPKAIAGAREAICHFRPKLAIATYHSLDDFVNIPIELNASIPNYDWHLGHFTIHSEETILFGIPKAGRLGS